MTTFPPTIPRTVSLAPTIEDVDDDEALFSPAKPQQPQSQSASTIQANTTPTNMPRANGQQPKSTIAKLLNNSATTQAPATPTLTDLMNPTPSAQHPIQHPAKPVQNSQNAMRSAYPPHSQARAVEFSPGVMRINEGGKIRLVKRTPTKASLFDDEGGDAMDGHGPAKVQGGRQNGHHQARESEEEVDEEMDEEMDALDLTAPVSKFDSHAELVEHWNGLQNELWGQLKKWGEDRIADAELSVRRVYYEVHQMTVRVRDELEQGVKDIEEQEGGHERARKMILEFQDNLKVAAARMGDFGPTSADRRGGQ